jgi:hypothetical protein
MAGKILSAIQFRAKTELKPIPSIYDEEISKLRDAPWGLVDGCVHCPALLVRRLLWL